MRTKRLALNAIINLIFQVCHFVIGIVLPKLLIDEFGSTLNGLMSSSNQFVGYFSYVESGISSALVYVLVRLLAKSDKENTNALLRANNRIYLKYSLFYLLGIIVFSFVYPFLIDTGSFSKLDSIILVLVICLAGFLDFLTLAKYRVLLTADQRGYVVSFASLVSLLLNFGLTFLFIKLHFPAYVTKLPAIFMVFIRSLILGLYVKKHYPYVNYSKGPVMVVAKFSSVDSLFFQISSNITVTLPVLLISFYSLVNASVFSVYNSIFSGITGIVAIFTTGSSSSFGDVIAKGEYPILKKAFSTFEFGIYFLVSVLLSVTIITLKPFLDVYTYHFDATYSDEMLAILFVVWAVFQNLRIPYSTLINASGLYKKCLPYSIGQIFLILVLGIPLTIFYGSYGLLAAMICSSLIGFIVNVCISNLFVFRFSIKDSILRGLRCCFLIGGCYALSLVPAFYYHVTSYGTWLLYALIVGFSCLLLALLLSFVFDFPSVKELFRRLLGIFKKDSIKKDQSNS